MNQGENIVKKKKDYNYILLIILLIFQTALLVYCFLYKKEGCNADEMWSYGYANSYYQKDIHLDSEGNRINWEKWVDSDVLRDYLVVNEGEQFQYDSVYNNQINDLSPPLHSMVLHTICSFFPEQFSLWYSFSINLVSFLIAIIFLWKWVALIKNEKFAFLICAFYGFSAGAIDNFVYLRMYAMETALLMIFLYYFLKVIKQNDKTIAIRYMTILFFVGIIGFLTQYYFISFVGLLTFFFCIYLLFQKKFKKMFQLGFTMLAALVLSFVLFPAIIKIPMHTTQDVVTRNIQQYNYNFEIRFKILMNSLLNREFNVGISYFSRGYLKIALGVAVFLVIVCIPLLYLFRDSAQLKAVMIKIKFFAGDFKTIIINKLKRFNWLEIILFAVVILQIIVVGETCNLAVMGVYVDRYVFYICSVFLVVFLSIVYWILKKILGKFYIKGIEIHKIVFVGVSVLCITYNIVGVLYSSMYYFPAAREGQSIEKIVEGKNVIYVDKINWLITAMAPKLMNSNQYFQVSATDSEKYTEEYKEKLSQGEVVLIVDIEQFMSLKEELNSTFVLDDEETQKEVAELQKKYNALIQYFEDLEPNSEMQCISRETVFGREMEVYIINPEKETVSK